MNIEEVKFDLEHNTWKYNNAIFKIQDTDFIAFQYIEKIAQIQCKQIEIVDNLESISVSKNELFEVTNSKLYVFKCESFDKEITLKDTYIICTKVDVDKCSNVIEIPKLTDLFIKDWLFSVCEGVSQSKLENLFMNTSNIYCLKQYVDIITTFNLSERESVLDELVSHNQIQFENSKTVFDFATSIVNFDLNALLNIYRNIDYIDINNVGLVTILIGQVRKLIDVKCNSTFSSELGITEKQFYYLKSHCGYSLGQLLKLYDLLTGMALKLKTGYLDSGYWVDYLILNFATIYSER